MDEIDAARCEYAMALSHGLFTGEVERIIQNNKTSLESLLYWKSERVQGFSKDEKTYNIYESLQSKLKQKQFVGDSEHDSEPSSESPVDVKKEITFE